MPQGLRTILAELGIAADAPPDSALWKTLLARLDALSDAARDEQGAIESRWRGLVEGAPDIILTTDLQGRIVFSNRPLGGASREAVVGRSVGSFIESWSESMFRGLLAAVGSNEGTIGFEAQARFRPEAPRWYSLRAAGNCLPDGTLIGVTIIATDVTDRRELEAQNERFRLLLDRAQDAIFVADPALGGRLVDCNATAVQLTGLGRSRILGRPLGDILQSLGGSTPQAFETWLGGLSAADGTRDGQDALRRADGGLVPVALGASLKRIGGAGFLLVTARDQSARIAMERELEDQRAKAVYAAKMASLGEMAGGVAHEINNPLTIIKGMAEHVQLLLRADPLDKDKILDKASRIRETALRIARIVRGLRAFSRDATKDPFVETSVAALFEDSLGLCAEAFRHADIKLAVVAPPPAMAVECRATEIAQVLLNLLSNARDAVRGREDRWVRLEAADQGEHVAIAVTDAGPGIAPNVRARMMEPFYTTKDVGEGTGLGLSISKGIAEAHGGKLLYDETATTTRFVLIVPKRQVGELPESKAS